jgi:AbrB family looped-hinge helix DNA binding protein
MGAPREQAEVDMASKVTEQGQVTIPQPVRDRLGIGPGSEVEFREAADGSVVLEKASAPPRPSRFADLVGTAGPGLTTDEIMALTRGE